MKDEKLKWEDGKIMFNVALSGEVPHARQNTNEFASALT